MESDDKVDDQHVELSLIAIALFIWKRKQKVTVKRPYFLNASASIVLLICNIPNKMYISWKKQSLGVSCITADKQLTKLALK